MITRDAKTGLIIVQDPEPTEPRNQASAPVVHLGRVIRIATMAHHLLDELRHAPLDERGRARVKKSYQICVDELLQALSPELAKELEELSQSFQEDAPSEAELRVAHAQLAGWLEGLAYGIQAPLLAQHAAGIAQLAETRNGASPVRRDGAPQHAPPDTRPGTYL
jgi:hypothetical protein